MKPSMARDPQTNPTQTMLVCRINTAQKPQSAAQLWQRRSPASTSNRTALFRIWYMSTTLTIAAISEVSLKPYTEQEFSGLRNAAEAR
uniref:Uncharacterized protein n=1 Tax=Anopheles albimanus TaxID=7167 RepID=A0A182FX38_ANOAL